MTTPTLDVSELMRGLSVSHVRFTVRASDTIVFEGQPGSQIRGALYAVLANNFCSEPFGPHSNGHADHCPVCWLLAQEDITSARGMNIPRPLTIQPPPARTYRPGERFAFGITLIGAAQDFFPYVARAVATMTTVGVGKGRGRFALEGIHEVNPLYTATRPLMTGHMVQRPTLQVTMARVNELSDPAASSITLELLTPTRLIAKGQLVFKPDPAVFMARLIERCEQLARVYAERPGDAPAPSWEAAYHHLTQLAATWTTAYDDTQWVDVFSGSKRMGKHTPIGGLVGTVRWEGEVGPAHAWLLWGQSLHVGKDTIKGNGWYRVVG